jgi:8-oxo-dGTP diphosphatase
MAYFESDFWHPSLATDVVLFTIRDRKLNILLVKRKDDGLWAIPGGFLKEGESLNQCAERELKEETGITVPYLEQFENFSNPTRDPRTQVISVAFIAVHPSGKLKLRADTDVSDVNWFDYNNIPKLAFDHNEICLKARLRLDKLVKEKPELLFPFLDKEFTLTELHDAFLIVSSDISSLKEKRNFRKWVAEYNDGKGMVKETSNFRTGNHRPAKLYTKL